MTAPSKTTIPRSVRVDGASPTPWLTYGHVGVVHLGQSAVVLADRRGPLVMTSAAFGLAPGGVQLGAADFARLRAEVAAGRTGLAHWTPDFVETVDLRIRSASIDPAAVGILRGALDIRRHAGTLDPSRQRSLAPVLARAALAGEPPEGPLLRLIGAGPGSTPAGDDVVVGVLAALRAIGREDAAGAISRGVLRFLDRTTSASRAYLSAAADGRFAERVHRLVRGLSDESAAMTAAGAASTWGATSGLDLLAGIVAAVDTPAVARRIA